MIDKLSIDVLSLIRKCTVCGKAFFPPKELPSAEYCSDDCYEHTTESKLAMKELMAVMQKRNTMPRVEREELAERIRNRVSKC